ncbi:MAG: hypothetical protein OET41_10675 [Xanthomonadales bacterium]|jgi:hypothetical protein|nr:hypothetical protein [Xanthomonadales bacterium]MDH3941975.1 hypothetical protein [Xanthomonadales bacterium]
MDDYHMVSLFGSENFVASPVDDRSTAKQHLQRKIRLMHAKHLLDCLFRLAAFGGLMVVGLKGMEVAWGEVAVILAGFLLAHTLWYCIKGCWSIARSGKAKLYWLQDSEAYITRGVVAGQADR